MTTVSCQVAEGLVDGGDTPSGHSSLLHRLYHKVVEESSAAREGQLICTCPFQASVFITLANVPRSSVGGDHTKA